MWQVMVVMGREIGDEEGMTPMRVIVLAIITFALLSEAQAQQQQQVQQQVKEFSITGSFEEISAVLQQLGKLPWNDVNPLMQRFIAQMNAQNPLSNSPNSSVQEGETK